MINNPFSMVVAIVAIVSIAGIIRARYGLQREHRRHRGAPAAIAQAPAETEALRAEIRALKERVIVLERLATDGSSALEREFEKLRQQD